jgi:hypothetical protein
MHIIVVFTRLLLFGIVRRTFSSVLGHTARRSTFGLVVASLPKWYPVCHSFEGEIIKISCYIS